MLVLDDHWVWDSWYLRSGDLWHCWYLKAPKSLGDPELRHWHVSQGHAVSTDLVNWTNHTTAMRPADAPAWDDMTTWTGSTLRGDDGQWHYFYTGTRQSENGKLQRIGHATGSDLETWNRAGDGLCLDLTGSAAEYYETDWQGVWHDRALRDPWVMKDPEGSGWLMYFTARRAGVVEANDAGCIGLAISDNLMDWELQPPVFTGDWGQLEVPQVFVLGDYWYCLFCMDPSHQSVGNREKNGLIRRGSHYLMSDSPRGPWRLPEGPALDTRVSRYAARMVDHDGLKLLGFKDETPDGFGGYIMDPVPVVQLADGRLTLDV